MPLDQTSYLIELLSGFGEPFGLERSLKVGPRRLLPDRFLLSIHKHALGVNPSKELFRLLQLLDCPEQACGLMQENLTEAEILHVGFEADGSRQIYKCYLEFPGRFRSAQRQSGADDGILAHIAAKWEPGVKGALTYSYYRGFTGLNYREVLDKIRNKIYYRGAGAVVLDALQAISTGVDTGIVDDVMLMLVSEPGNSRLSFDLNIYDWEKTIAAIRTQLDCMLSSFNIPVAMSRRYLDRYAGDMTGHISGGYDRAGNEFFTLYHGVEEVVP